MELLMKELQIDDFPSKVVDITQKIQKSPKNFKKKLKNLEMAESYQFDHLEAIQEKKYEEFKEITTLNGIFFIKIFRYKGGHS
jgi:hypothetical protein